MQLFCNDAEWNRCKAREKRASLAFRILAAAVPAAFIVLCLLIRTGNAKTMHALLLSVTAVLGSAAIVVYVLVLRPARRELKHMEMLRSGTRAELEGTLTLTKETIRVPRSVLVRRAVLETGEERPVLLNVDERWAHRMPPDGPVRVAAVHSYVAGAEAAGGSGARAEEAEARKPSRARAFFRGAAALAPALILWVFATLIFGSFIFYQVTDTDRAHKIAIYIDGTTTGEDQLAERIEQGMADPIRMVKVHPFSYVMFGDGELQTADLYIVPDSRREQYAEWLCPPEESVVVFDPEAGISVAGAYIDYTPEGEEPEIWRLYTGAASPHLEDGLAGQAAELLMRETDKEADK